MPRLFVALLIVVCGAVYSVSARRTLVAPEVGRAGFRVATFNIHKGADRENRYNLQRTIEAIAALDADLVGLQEVIRNDPQFNCDDQPALIAEGLRRVTGRRWAHVYARAWTSDNDACLDRGRGDGVATEGLAFLSPERIVATGQVPLPQSRMGLMARVATMPDTPVILTHLTASRRSEPDRISQIDTLLRWAALQGPGVLMGDLNSRPEGFELTPIMARYRDAWLEASERGLTRGVTSGSTRPGGQARIDFVFYAPGSALELQAVEIIDTTTLPGLGEVSDHRPGVATFRRRSRESRAKRTAEQVPGSMGSGSASAGR
jgi:endonuclease/exonuclease/phosphatase family metal-dependent hydrolase